MNLYYLGPKGTYSEMAANCISSKIQNLSLVPISTIAKVVDLVNNEKKSLGIIPIENSIDGIVRPALDNIYSHNVSIQAELEIKINHCLVSNATSFGDIKKILSHPQAIAQCQKF
ncbi:prephenate dehydratase, partial [bacterium]|nr:prephenate dehydratase [bacterium]